MSYVADWFVLAILSSFLHFVLLEFLWATGPEAIVARQYGPSFLMAVLFAVVNCLQTFAAAIATALFARWWLHPDIPALLPPQIGVAHGRRWVS